MREEFFNALVDCLIGSSEELDEDIAEDWDAVDNKLLIKHLRLYQSFGAR